MFRFWYSVPVNVYNCVSEWGVRYDTNIRNLNKAWVHLISPCFLKVLDGFKFSKNKTNKNPYSDINLPTWLL